MSRSSSVAETLIRGLRLQRLPFDKTADLDLFLNSGTCLERRFPEHEQCFLPRDDWRPASERERDLLLSSQPVPAADAVTLVEIDPSLRDTFWEEILPRIVNASPAPTPEERSALLGEFAERIVASLSVRSSITARSLGSCDIAIVPPHRPSTAFNFKSRSYVGLHIDNQGKHSLEERRNAFQLLSINFGRAKRYFHFVNLSVPDILDALGIEIDADAEESFFASQALKDLFLDKFNEYPVVRVVLEPDQAYITVNKNCIHDGATNTEGHPDVSLLLGGHFEWANNLP